MVICSDIEVSHSVAQASSLTRMDQQVVRSVEFLTRSTECRATTMRLQSEWKSGAGHGCEQPGKRGEATSRRMIANVFY